MVEMVARGRLLLLDGDEGQRAALEFSLAPHFMEVIAAGTMAQAIAIARSCPLAAALLALVLPDGDGLDVIPFLLEEQPGLSLVVLTSFGSCAAAVESIKLGARDFLARPASVEQIVVALDGRDRCGRAGDRPRSPGPIPLSLECVEWEHIHRVLSESEGNISEAARRLGLRRQSLQRKLRALSGAPGSGRRRSLTASRLG